MIYRVTGNDAIYAVSACTSRYTQQINHRIISIYPLPRHAFNYFRDSTTIEELI